MHDVADAEGLCARIIQRSSLTLSFHEHEDLLAFLVETAWELSLSYEPGDLSFPPNFSTYANTILSRRCFDWKRGHSGRTTWRFADRVYERKIPELFSFDDPQRLTRNGTESSLADDYRSELADSTSTVDVDRVRELDLGRLLRTRGSGPARRNGEMGTAPDKRAA
ncbi:MAG TPA: hypothetical protein VNH41_06120 [Steroidobacteraceae bacterium]|nr:hypothetical protein [Steroidobacteraceae bacterium]